MFAGEEVLNTCCSHALQTRSGITATWLDCPFDSNQPQNCDPSSNIFSYTCYAIINLPDKIV